jgi:hypothetical protein
VLLGSCPNLLKKNLMLRPKRKKRKSPELFVFVLARDCLTPPARLPRNVPEKAEAFLREALCAASHELPPFVAMIAW